MFRVAAIHAHIVYAGIIHENPTQLIKIIEGALKQPFQSDADEIIEDRREDGETLPVTKQGWMKKQGRMMPTWKTRYFVLELGVLTYFKEDVSGRGPSRASFGTESTDDQGNETGRIHLAKHTAQRDFVTDATLNDVIMDAGGDHSDGYFQIQLLCDGVVNLFLKPLDSLDCANWKAALDAHIKYANDQVAAQYAPRVGIKRYATLDTRSKGKSILPPSSASGMIEKEGHIMKNWKTRFFILENGIFSYYKPPVESAAAGASEAASSTSSRGLRKAVSIDERGLARAKGNQLGKYDLSNYTIHRHDFDDVLVGNGKVSQPNPCFCLEHRDEPQCSFWCN